MKTKTTYNPNAQKSDLIAGQKKVWGDAEQLCATIIRPGVYCENSAERFSCYCRKCENAMNDSAAENG